MARRAALTADGVRSTNSHRTPCEKIAESPENTLVVSPDNRSRAEISERIHAELQRAGLVSGEAHHIRTLVPRQDLTGADRTWAERYEAGDVLRYSRSSKETGIGKGEYAKVKSIDAPKNRLTVELRDGTERTYDPRRQQGVSVFREEMRSFSIGDRIQFTAPAHELKVANRELGTIESVGEHGPLRLRMDGGRKSTAEARSVSRLCDRVPRRASPGLDTDLSGLGLSFLYPGNVRYFLYHHQGKLI